LNFAGAAVGLEIVIIIGGCALAFLSVVALFVL
jgi:hypothetical protein